MNRIDAMVFMGAFAAAFVLFWYADSIPVHLIAGAYAACAGMAWSLHRELVRNRREQSDAGQRLLPSARAR